MWNPNDSKVTNFGHAWLDLMGIPETADLVLGEDDPGGGTVNISAMGSASAQAFAYIENNLQFIRDVMIFDDVNINVASTAQLQAALDVLDRVVFVAKGKVFSITMTAGTYVWPVPGTESRSAIHIEKVHGGGTVLFTVASGTVTIEGEGTLSRPLLYIGECTCSTLVSGPVVLKNNAAAGVRGATFYKVRQAEVTGLDIRNDTGDTLTTGVYCREVEFLQLGLTINTVAPTHTGVGRAIYARVNCNIHIDAGDLTLGDLTNELIYLEKNSQIVFERFDGWLPDGADMSNLTARGVVTVDASSRLVAHDMSATGAGTRASPYQITIAWESGADTALLVQNLIDALPRPFDVWLLVKLPAGTMTDPVYIEDIDGRGGLILEANTPKTDFSNTQDTIIDDASNALVVNRCGLSVIIDSLKLDNETGEAGLKVANSRNVELWYSYVQAATGTGAIEFGNGVKAEGADTNLYIYKTYFGACNQAGVRSLEGAKVAAPVNKEYSSPTDRPQTYGNRAFTGGTILRGLNAGEFITGATGVDSEDAGGKIWSS